jgi:hypothetical protein
MRQSLPPRWYEDTIQSSLGTQQKLLRCRLINHYCRKTLVRIPHLSVHGTHLFDGDQPRMQARELTVGPWPLVASTA